MSPAPTLWEEGRERGRNVVALGIALALTLVVVDLWLSGEVGLVFDIGFVVLCLTMALLVRFDDFFTVGVCPPLLLLGTFVLLAVASPGTIADPRDGVIQAVVTGLAAHSVALGCGYLICLVTLAMRHHVIRTRSARRRRRPDARPLEHPPTSR